MKVLETEVAVIGAGAAGLCAGIRIAEAGGKVLVIDENHLPGGQLFKQIHKFFGSSAHQAGTRGFCIGQDLLDHVEAAGAKVMLDSVAYGLFPDGSIGVMQDGHVCSIRTKKIIIAAGAQENYLVLPGSTLPGVIGAGAAQTMINVNRVLPGHRIVMVGSGNVGLIVSYQLMQAGAEVVEVVEAAPSIGGYGVHAGKIRRAGVPINVGTTIHRILGTDSVTGVEIVNVDEQFQEIPDTIRKVDCDTVCLAVGLNPLTELAWMAGCQFVYLPPFGGHVPLHDENMETTVPGIYVAGDITGVEEASSAMEEGNLAGVAVAEALGYITHDAADRKKQEIRARLLLLRSGGFGAQRRKAKAEQISAMSDWQEKEGA